MLTTSEEKITQNFSQKKKDFLFHAYQKFHTKCKASIHLLDAKNHLWNNYIYLNNLQLSPGATRQTRESYLKTEA